MERIDARTYRDMKNRLVAVLLLTGAVLTNIGWTGQALGQEKLPRVGILTFYATTDNPTWEGWFEFFRRPLADHGWVEGKTVLFEYRNAGSDPAKLGEAAKQLAERGVDVIWAPSAPAVRAAYAATRTIPIVAVDYTNDPVTAGYAISYARPDANVTGVFLDAPEFAGKWFELLKEMIPDLSRVSVLWDPGPGDTHLKAVRSVAKSLDIKLQVLEVHKPDDIDRAFESLHGQTQALIFLPSPMIHIQSARLARLSLKHQKPATSSAHEFGITGGLLAYGPDSFADWPNSAVLVAKILGGAKPGNLPIVRPARFILVVNRKTAKALGTTIPQSILLRADKVIE